MPLFLVESVFQDDLIPVNPHQNQPNIRSLLPDTFPGVTWTHRFRTEDGMKTYYLVEAPSPAVVRNVAHECRVPVDRLTTVVMTDFLPFLPDFPLSPEGDQKGSLQNGSLA